MTKEKKMEKEKAEAEKKKERKEKFRDMRQELYNKNSETAVKIIFSISTAITAILAGILLEKEHIIDTTNPNLFFWLTISLVLLFTTTALQIFSLNIANLGLENLGSKDEATYSKGERQINRTIKIDKWRDRTFLLGLAAIVMPAILKTLSILVEKNMLNNRETIMNREYDQPYEIRTQRPLKKTIEDFRPAPSEQNKPIPSDNNGS